MATTNGTPTVSPVAKIEALYDRLTRARTLVADNKVHPVFGMADHYFVEGKEAKYLVNGSCICPDSVNRPELKGLCKHKLAVTIYAEQQAIADSPQVVKATSKGSITPLESDRSLEDQLEDLYPKARPTNSLK
jgi:predicted nucleic acid-binding Zn finger protein